MAPAPPSAPPPEEHSLWWLGMVLMVGSTVAGAVGGLAIRKSHLIARSNVKLSWAYWLVGIFVVQLILNVGMSMAALAFAAQSLLSPLIACQIVFNALLAPCALSGEVLTLADAIGTALIVAGCVAAGISAPHSDQHYSLPQLLADYQRPSFIAYSSGCAALMLGCYLSSLQTRFAAVRRVGASSLPGFFVGNANIFAKAASGLFIGAIAHGDWEPFQRPLPYVVMVVAPSMAALSLLFLNRALAAFPATSVVPTYISTLVVVSTLSGGIYFGEFKGLTTARAVGLAAGVLLVVLGVSVQASGGRPDARRHHGIGGGDDLAGSLHEAFCDDTSDSGGAFSDRLLSARALRNREEQRTASFVSFGTRMSAGVVSPTGCVQSGISQTTSVNPL